MHKRVIAVVLGVLLLDQLTKLWIKLTWTIGQRMTLIPGFFELHFIENNGMAFGIALPGDWGKIALSLFRLLAVGAIGWYIAGLIKSGAHKGFITSVSLILAGAFGNIVDSAVYGLLFGRSTYTQVADFLPADGGYAGFLKGFVVDMFHFTVRWPDWVPYFGGSGAEIFPPIFNVADAAITVGVIWILIRQRAYFPKEEKPAAVEEGTGDDPA